MTDGTARAQCRPMAVCSPHTICSVLLYLTVRITYKLLSWRLLRLLSQIEHKLATA